MTTEAASKPLVRDLAQRWTPALATGGFTPIVNSFLENYSKLDPPITASEILLIVHLIRFKWDDAAPHPSFGRLAQLMGATDSAVRNHARSLERKGYLRRKRRFNQSSLFDLNPLFEALERVAFRARA